MAYPKEEIGIDAVIEAYKSLRSFAGIAKPNTTPTPFVVTSNGAAGAPFNIQHIDLATSGGEIRGDAFTVNNDGTITVNKSMFAASVSLLMIATTSFADSVVVGIGIGNETQIPTTPGNQVGENCVSRFRCSRSGLLTGAEVTWDMHVTPVGKATTEVEVFGLKAGDKIFPVVWTQEADDATLNVVDLIFTVEEISV